MYFKHNNLSLFYEKYGNGKQTILILPGWGNTRPTFQSFIQEFQNKYTIYIMDYPGVGNSPIPPKELTIYDYADCICSFIKEVSIKNPIIIAHSFGGRITALLVSKFHIKPKKIVLIDVAGMKRRELKVIFKEKLYKFLKKFISLLPKVKQDKYRRKLFMKFASSDYQNLPKCMQKTFQNIIQEDLRNDYKKITCETLILWGEKDVDTPLKDAYYLHRVIPESGLIIYSNASHFSYLEYSQLTIEILKNFF